MSPTPAVSVVIASYNSASYAETAVASVLEQTFRDFEIVLVDDGSDVASAAILDTLARHEKVKLHRQPNRGCFRSRRVGWERARGGLTRNLWQSASLVPWPIMIWIMSGSTVPQ